MEKDGLVMDEKIIIAIIGSGALSALISGLVTIITSLIEKKKGSDDLLLNNTAIILTLMAHGYLADRHIDSEGLKLFMDTYKLYKEKDGNGYIDNLKTRIEKLPLKEEDD